MIQHKLKMMNKGKIFGFTKNLFFGLVIVFLAMAAWLNLMIFVYLSIGAWVIGFIMHVMYAKYERRNMKNALFGV